MRANSITASLVALLVLANAAMAVPVDCPANYTEERLEITPAQVCAEIEAYHAKHMVHPWEMLAARHGRSIPSTPGVKMALVAGTSGTWAWGNDPKSTVSFEYQITPEHEKNCEGKYLFWGVGWTWVDCYDQMWVFHLQKGRGNQYGNNYLVFYGKMPHKKAEPPEHSCPPVKPPQTIVLDQRVTNNYTTVVEPQRVFIAPGGIAMSRNPGLVVGERIVTTTQRTILSGAVGWRHESTMRCTTPTNPNCPTGTPGTPPNPGSVANFPLQPPSNQERGGYNTGGQNAPPAQATRLPAQPWQPGTN